MKKVILTSIVVLSIGIIAISCKENKKDAIEVIEVEDTTKNAIVDSTDVANKDEMAMATYQCPMKCEVDKTYNKHGSCPVCKMDLKEIESDKEEEDHENHDHE